MSAAGGNGRAGMQRIVLDVVADLIIFFEAQLVHALQHSLVVVKPATGDCDTEYFLKRSNGRLTKSAIMAAITCSGTNSGMRSCVAANTALYNSHVLRVISAYMTGNAAAPQRANTVRS